jgi:hypothetical protein
LILKKIPFRGIFGQRAQALDFSGRAAYGRPSFNKVIHKAMRFVPNVC